MMYSEFDNSTPPSTAPLPPQVCVEFKEATLVSCIGGVTTYDVVFNVIFDTSEVIAVTRRLVIDNATMAKEARNSIPKSIFVEQVQDMGLGKLRELAGIPGKGTYL